MVFDVSFETRGTNIEANVDVGVSRGSKGDFIKKCDRLCGDKALVVFKDNSFVQNSTPNVQFQLLKRNESCTEPKDSVSPVACPRHVETSNHMITCVVFRRTWS